jgi:signal transduction histidine kinase
VVTDATGGLGFEPGLQFDGPLESIDVHLGDHLTLVLRDALSNLARPSGTVRIVVSVTEDLTLTVSDDGLPAEVFGGRGLSNMAERARALGGDVTVKPGRSGGSLLVWKVPIAWSRQPA